MYFWYYAFWYLIIGVCIDRAFSERIKPSFWTIALWPVIILTALIMAIITSFGDRD